MTNVSKDCFVSTLLGKMGKRKAETPELYVGDVYKGYAKEKRVRYLRRKARCGKHV